MKTPRGSGRGLEGQEGQGQGQQIWGLAGRERLGEPPLGEASRERRLPESSESGVGDAASPKLRSLSAGDFHPQASLGLEPASESVPQRAATRSALLLE